VLTVDLSFSKGQFPEEHDFPMNLRSEKLSAVLPLYRMGLWNAAKTSVQEVGKPQANSGQSFHQNSYNVAKDRAAIFNSAINSFKDIIPSVQVGNIDSGYQIESASSSCGDQAFAAPREFSTADISEGSFRDFDLDTWIYDFLPNFG
jgi:hypothetical protein